MSSKRHDEEFQKYALTEQFFTTAAMVVVDVLRKISFINENGDWI